MSPRPWLLAHVPWTDARHAILARGADDQVAAHLGLAVGDPCLVIERRNWNDATPVTYARFWDPGGDHSLEGSFMQEGMRKSGAHDNDWRIAGPVSARLRDASGGTDWKQTRPVATGRGARRWASGATDPFYRFAF